MKLSPLPFTASLLLCALVGCQSGGSSSAREDDERTTPKLPIPSDSPFAKIKEGMTPEEVFATIGRPTSTDSYITGKGFIPFRFGGDNSRMAARYKGIGELTFSQNSSFTSGMSLIDIEYNPEEAGYDRSNVKKD